MAGLDPKRAISESPFFQTMTEEDRVTLAQTADLYEHGEGEILFRPRELPSALYLVVDGVVEISRREEGGGELESVAYVGPGATLAASKIITGTPFEAQARFPAGGQTLQWSRAAILRRLFSSRAFSLQYLQNLARRLEGSFAVSSGRIASKLGGRLDHFDLPTILQTVVDSGAVGVLEVMDARGARFGSIYTENRRVGPVSCGALAGAEAFFQILVTPPQRGTFNFSSAPAPQSADRLYDLAPLLLEAARIQDEFRRFRSELPGHLPLRPTGGGVAPATASDRELEELIRTRLAVRSCGWDSLADSLPYSRCRVALAVRDLVREGVLVVMAEPGHGAA